ncbi:MAG: serine/threonine protein kinase [Deltaproteobacteria bacterium]|nr:serine/threonine protein kinase [Deltaproteobacteria bacterium]MBN2674134.1 serine/threonine protein kinase [Deltaproteobacteria bacterium]
MVKVFSKRPSARPKPPIKPVRPNGLPPGTAAPPPPQPTPQPAKGGDQLIGTIIGEKYLIEELLGEGGMGHVYRARHIMMGKPFAIKLIHAELAHVDEIAKRFQREARSSSLLTHPNCISVTDFGEYGDAPNRQLFLAMELLEGEELDQRLSREKALSPVKAVNVISQVLKGLGHAHEQGVIHRDLKPENIFLTPLEDGTELVKILDFGIAKMADGGSDADNLTKTGVVFGTPKYLSPEQALGDKIDHRADLYAVGVILFEMLVGQPPFKGKTAMDIMSAHLTAEPPKLTDFGPFPKELQRIITKAMAKKPDQRYANAAEFLAAVEAVDLQDSKEITIVIPNVANTQVMGRMKKALVSTMKNLLVGIVLFAIIALGVGYFLLAGHTTQEKPPGVATQKKQKPLPEPKTGVELANEEIKQLLDVAVKELEAANYKEAEVACRKALIIDAKSPPVKLMLGHVLFESGKQVGGIYQYQQAIDLSDKYAQDEQMIKNLRDGLQWESIRKKAAMMLAKYGSEDELAKLTELASSALTAGDVRRAVRSALEKNGKAQNVDWASSLQADFHELKNCKDRNQIIAQMVQTGNKEFIPFLEQFRPKKTRKGKKKSPNACLKASIEYALNHLSKQPDSANQGQENSQQ